MSRFILTKITLLSLAAFVLVSTEVAAMEKYPDYLETMARDAEVVLLAKKDQLFAEATAEWETDRKSYTFECRRFGDFLSVFIARDANPKKMTPWSSPRKYATAINIAAAREIHLIEGHPPDLEGSFAYQGNEGVYDRNTTGAVELEYQTMEKKTKTAFFKAIPASGYPVIPSYGREVFRLDPLPQQGDIISHLITGTPSKYRTQNYVRVAVDDQIRFEGVGATIFVPFGMGQQVYDSILREVAKP